MLLTCEEMQHAEHEAFSRGVTAEGLMDEAGHGLARVVFQFHASPGRCIVYAGKGHNAGDAFVAARHLALAGWKVELRFAFPEYDLAPLTARKLAEFREADASAAPHSLSPKIIVLDGLLGLGASGQLRSPIKEMVAEINDLRRQGAWVLAIDIPSGLNGNTGEPGEPCVQADVTATIAMVKVGLVADRAINFVGRLAVVPLPELTGASADSWSVSSVMSLRSWLPPRQFDTHKGQCGRIGIIAGSPGFIGAARLCSTAAVRAGAGLITLFTRPEIHEQLAISCPPEVMVRQVNSYRDVLHENLDVIAIGPGLGHATSSEVLSVIRDAPQPVVVDADALNVLSQNMALLLRCKGPRLLTPHPGEMERLFPQGKRSRKQWAEDFLETYPVTLLLKGARTIITSRNEAGYFNSTGTPGMASGGMGDVLTGVCAALAGQGVNKSGENMLPCAVLGAWLCGRAAEMAVSEQGGSAESLCASDVIAHLGGAVTDLRVGAY